MKTQQKVKIMRRLAVLAFVLATPHLALAEVEVENFRTMLVSDKPRAIQLISAVGDSYGWANSVLEKDGRQKLFCVAPNKRLDGNELAQILETEYKRFEADYKNAKVNFISIVVLRGLQRVYPCDDKQAERKSP